MDGWSRDQAGLGDDWSSRQTKDLGNGVSRIDARRSLFMSIDQDLSQSHAYLTRTIRCARKSQTEAISSGLEKAAFQVLIQ